MERWRRNLILTAAILALASIAAEYGFYLSPSGERLVRLADLVIVALFLVVTVMTAFTGPNRRRALMKALPPLAIAGIFAVQLLTVKLFLTDRPGTEDFLGLVRIQTVTRLYFVILQGYILFSLVFHARALSQRLADARVRPARLLIGTFAVLIVAGTLALKMPRSVPLGDSLDWIDALFTATSAVCVTGLIVVDTATAFSKTGHFVIMMLMQLGGLGIMTFAAFFALMLGSGLGIRERVLMRQLLNVEFVSRVGTVVITILSITVIAELAGTVALYFTLPYEEFTIQRRVFNAAFHSISAFCNAGFSTYSRGMEPFYADAVITFIVAALIIGGGLGFVVQLDVFSLAKSKLNRRPRPFKLRVQTKAVLATSAVLLGLGTVGFFILEGGSISLLQAFFQSVTSRTAGFATTPTAQLGEGSQFLTMLLMFIGAAPGSTGGGIKVTTVAVIVATVASVLRGRPRTEMFRKSIPQETVREALVVASIAVFAISLGLMLLLSTESAGFRSILFEVVSAFGTVGLSLGLTGDLTMWGKTVIVATMFFGRLGPMMIGFALAGRVSRADYTYPTEKVLVG